MKHLKELKKLHKEEAMAHRLEEKEMHKDKKLHKRIEELEKKIDKVIKHHKVKKEHKKKDPKTKHAAKSKVEKVMHEYKEGMLHAGSKKGPVVKNKKQALAIALSEARRAKRK